MNITHVFLYGEYTDNWSYQENMMTKFQSRAGHSVSLITTEWAIGNDGKSFRINQNDYIDDFGVRIIRLPIKGGRDISYKFKRFDNIYLTLDKLNPNVIFVHCPQFLDVDKVLNYKKDHPEVRLYVDNHADFENSATNWLSKNILHKIIWRYFVQKLLPYTEKIYGVLPARVDFLKTMYDVPSNKCELLVMGADIEIIRENKQKCIRKKIREMYKIDDDCVLVLSGGKIDKNKPEVLNLMEAFAEIGIKNTKLMIFGSVIDEYKTKFNELLSNSNVIYVGWLKSEDIYAFFEASDLIVFPGLHSVLWEQAVGTGKACLFRKLEGFDHVDLGGNCEFINGTSKKVILNKLKSVLENNNWKKMQEIAQTKGIDYFSYEDISKRSIC